MLQLLIATIFAANFGLIINYSLRRKANLYAIGTINYAVAALLYMALNRSTGQWLPQPGTWLTGILCAVAYVAGFLLLFPTMQRRGVCIAAAMQRTAVVMPIAVGLILWGEHLAALQAIGVALALLSLPLLTWHPGARDSGSGKRGVLLLLALFLANGCGMVAFRWFSLLGIEGQSLLFLALVFALSALLTGIAWCTHRQTTQRRDLILGVLLGIDNCLANLALMASLDHLPGVLVFPFYSSVGIIISMVCARLIWKERISRQELGGMGLAVAAVVLANL